VWLGCASHRLDAFDVYELFADLSYFKLHYGLEDCLSAEELPAHIFAHLLTTQALRSLFLFCYGGREEVFFL
jgi:hypothetical protein